MAIQLTISQQLKVKIKKLGINGEGIANYKGRILFVPNALPKEEVLVQVTKNTPTFTEAKIKQIIHKSKERIKPACPIYERCGACQLQHLSYPAQLAFKKDLLEQALRKFKPENYENYRLPDTIGMKNPFHYRNKAQFQLGIKNNHLIAGLYQENTHQLVEVKDCLVQKEETQEILNTAVNLLNQYHAPVYNERKKSGVFRTLVARFAFQTNEAQLVFITANETFPHKQEILRALTEKHPMIVSIMQNIQNTTSSHIFGEKTIHLWGKESIQEQMQQVTFDLSARAFFQLNPVQTNILYQETRKALDIKPHDKVVDAYCGVGTIGLSFAHKVAAVRGMDIVPEAIQDANKNAKRLGLTNCAYFVGTAESLLPKWVKEGFEPTSIVVDPPRSGLDEQLIAAIIRSTAQKLVYVSCNPSTLARDLVKLAKHFHVEYLQSVDMFPMTARCEVIVKLTRK